MPGFNEDVMLPDLNTMPNQQLSMQLDANVNEECIRSKRSNYHITVSDDDEEDGMVFLGETSQSESGHHCPSKRQRVEAHPPPNDETLGSGVEAVEPTESDEQTEREDVEANNGDTTVPLETRKKRDVSLVERFTEEEIEMHLKSLHEGIVELKDNETCQLCGQRENELVFPAPPLYCSLCSGRIGDESLYYIPEEAISGEQHQICSPCYDHCRRKKFTLSGVDIVKDNMLKLNNANNQETEAWVACESCGKWQHQICGLYNIDKDIDNTSDYICPYCLLEERRSNNNMGCDDNTDLGAKDLPETILSDFIERRLTRRLRKERHQTAEATGMSIDDVSVPDDLTLRVVFSADKSSHVSKTFVDFLHNEHYPSEFPHRSKVILLFQKVDGVDVCIFALIVQEFGSECSQPNKRSVYIGYLDSVKYFRPERVTFSGESLRTFVYHEILIGYLEYCKFRGFTTGYIWVCPPVKGQDYIMYSHPTTQQTPSTVKLRQWYVSMLDKAKEQRIVTDVTNLYDRFFVSTCSTTAARLPYFEESFWSSNAEVMSQQIESDGKNVKSRSRRALEGSKSKDANDAKNILLMQKLGKLISDHKEDLIVVDLNYTCTRCSEAILSGLRWFCNKCKNLQLCERCHDLEPELPGEHTYTMNDEDNHSLSNVVMNIPSTTEDNDIILGNNTFEDREMFLTFSQKHNYTFDTLRRAKNSSMMILHHLHTSNKLRHSQNSSGGLLQVVTCMACQKDVSRTIYYTSLCCSSYRACTSCYNNKKILRLLHLFPVVPATHGIPPRTAVAFEILQALLHANACRSTATSSCSYPRCSLVKILFNHIEVCEKQRGACRTCMNFARVICIHAYHCQDPSCSIPRCSGMKEEITVRGLR